MPPDFSYRYHVVLLAAWLAYVFLHSLLASPTVKMGIQKLMGRNYSYYRLTYSIFAAVTLAVVLAYQFSQPSPLLFDGSYAGWVVGGILAMAGFIGMGICIRKYFLNLSGVDVLMKQQREPVLEIGGLHRFVRHPLYSTTLLFCWSLFLLFPYVDNLIACGVITVYTLIGIVFEEKKLVEAFGSQYSSYSRSTPMLIPNFRRGQSSA